MCAVLTLFLRYFLLELYYALLLILHTLLFSFLTDAVRLSDDDTGWLADSAVALLAESALRGRCV